jgi:hypothetical protein
VVISRGIEVLSDMAVQKIHLFAIPRASIWHFQHQQVGEQWEGEEGNMALN